MALDPRIVLLIGADTAIVDESSYARTLTAVGNVASTSAQAKYGTGSLTFDGVGDGVQAAASADLSFGSGDFTVEGWFRFVTKADNQALMGQWDGSWWFLFIVGGQLVFRSALSADVSYTWTPTLGQWYHIAVDRSGSTLRVYVGGAVVATNPGFGGSFNTSGIIFTLGTIGTTNGFPGFDFNGQMDEVRITKGLAQYAGAFTPPTGPFPRGSTATEGRVTQDAIETLSQPTNVAARVSQDAVETLSQPVHPAARVSQSVIEVLGATVGAFTSAQVTQSVIELLTLNPPTEARVSQGVIELLAQTPGAAARATQLAAEIFNAAPATTRATQLALEVFLPIAVPTRVTQQVVEFYNAAPATARVTQEAVEIFLIKSRCTYGGFPVDPGPAPPSSRRQR